MAKYSGFASRSDRWFSSLHQVPERDPWTFAITIAILLVVVLLAAWLPPVALAVDPLIALKQQ